MMMGLMMGLRAVNQHTFLGDVGEAHPQSLGSIQGLYQRPWRRYHGWWDLHLRFGSLHYRGDYGKPKREDSEKSPALSGTTLPEPELWWSSK